MRFSVLIFSGILLLLSAGSALAAEWYQSYEKGYKAVEKGKCAEGVPLLKEAVAKKSQPDLKARPYGMITWEYIPHYYLAKCAVEAGDYAAAKQYLDAALQIDMGSSSKSADFRRIQKIVQEKSGGDTKTAGTPGTGTPTTTKPATTKPTTTPTTTTPTTTKPGPTTTPPKNEGAEREAIIARVLGEAQQSFAAGDYDSAIDAADRVLVLDRSNMEALRLKQRVQDKQAAASAAQMKKQRIADARRALSQGDFAGAESIAVELRAQYSSDNSVTSLISEIARAKSEKMKTMEASDSRKLLERQIINAYYTGKYNAVVELADQAIQQHPDSWRLLFYKGCALAALSILDERNHDQRLTQARDAFRKARTVAGSDINQPPQISPKIWEVYRSS